MKQILSMLLALCLSVGLLAGCGGGEDSDAAKPTAEILTEERYTAHFQTPEFPKEAVLQHAAFDGGTAVISCRVKAEDDERERYETRLYAIGEDGSVKRLAYEPLADLEPQPGRDHDRTENTVSALLLVDGEILTGEMQYESWYDDPADVQTEEHAFLRRFDRDGNEQEGSPIPVETADENGPPFRQMTADGDGNLYAALGGTVEIYTPNWEKRAEAGLGDWIYDTTRLRDGRVLALTYRNGLQLSVLMLDGSVAETHMLAQFPDSLYPGAGDYDFLYTRGTGLYGYRMEEEQEEQVLDWLACDMSPDDVRALSMEEDGTLHALCQEIGEEIARSELVTVRKEAVNPAEEKTVLTLGCLAPNRMTLSRSVLNFNRHSDTARIELRDYTDLVYNEDDYDQAIMKLTTEMMSGNMPDLLLTDNMPLTQMAAKGLLEDLYPYLDADAELKREDIFPKVLQAMEFGGNLVQVAPGFSIITVMGASSVVGDTPGWTYDDYDAALARMPEDCLPFGPYVNRENILEMSSYLEMGRYVDWTTGTCRFDSPGFIRLLEFAGSFPASPAYEGDGSESDRTRIAEGKQMLVVTGIYSMDEAVYNEQLFDGAATYIGYPTASGEGNILMLSEGFAMSSTCRDKEAGWEFLREYLTEDYQAGIWNYALPTNREAFQQKLDQAMQTDYETDAEGNYILDADGKRIPKAKGSIGMSQDSDGVMEFTLYAMTQEQADKMLAVIDSASTGLDMNVSLMSIIKEGAAAYFAGQKSAEECARLIQSKASLYVSEQR